MAEKQKSNLKDTFKKSSKAGMNAAETAILAGETRDRSAPPKTEWDFNEAGRGVSNWLDMMVTLFFDRDNFELKCDVYGYCDDVDGMSRLIERSVGAYPNAPDGTLEQKARHIVDHVFDEPCSPLAETTLMNPDLVKLLVSDADANKYYEMLKHEVETYNASLSEDDTPLDLNLMANQIYQESGFDPNKKGYDGKSMGIAQFTEGKAGEYGLSAEDRFDPQKALAASVAVMGDYTQKYNSQVLGLVAYNGGEGAIKFAAKNTPDATPQTLTEEQWMTFMQDERMEKGLMPQGAWRVTTYNYVTEIVPGYWHPDEQQQALQAMKDNGFEVNENPCEAPVQEIEPEPEPEIKPVDSPCSP